MDASTLVLFIQQFIIIATIGTYAKVRALRFVIFTFQINVWKIYLLFLLIIAYILHSNRNFFKESKREFPSYGVWKLL